MTETIHALQQQLITLYPQMRDQPADKKIKADYKAVLAKLDEEMGKLSFPWSEEISNI